MLSKRLEGLIINAVKKMLTTIGFSRILIYYRWRLSPAMSRGLLPHYRNYLMHS